MTEPVQLSVEYLRGVRDGNEPQVRKSKDRVSNQDLGTLGTQLSDAEKKCFWCNLYNAFVRERIRDTEPNLGSSYGRIKFFYFNRLNVASKSFSLQKMEHSVLRRGNYSFGLGYIRSPVSVLTGADLSPSSIDYRIHFLLNCGAESCPMIRILTPDNFEQQANTATEAYLNDTIKTEEDGDVVRVPRIMAWYRGDFGGKEGIVEVVNEYTDHEVSQDVKLEFDDYNWTLDFDSFR